MTALQILGKIRQKQTELEVTDKDLMRITGWSRSTFRRRIAQPGSMTVDELLSIFGYLNIKMN